MVFGGKEPSELDEVFGGSWPSRFSARSTEPPSDFSFPKNHSFRSLLSTMAYLKAYYTYGLPTFLVVIIALYLLFTGKILSLVVA